MNRDPFDNLGHPVPYDRREHAYETLKEIAPGGSPAKKMNMIDRACQHIERDEPYAAQRVLTGGAPLPVGDVEQVDGEPVAGLALDVTGMYRIFACLLTDPPRRTKEVAS